MCGEVEKIQKLNYIFLYKGYIITVVAVSSLFIIPFCVHMYVPERERKRKYFVYTEIITGVHY